MSVVVVVPSSLFFSFLYFLYHHQRKEIIEGPPVGGYYDGIQKTFCDAIRSGDELITICPAPQHNCITHIQREDYIMKIKPHHLCQQWKAAPPKVANQTNSSSLAWASLLLLYTWYLTRFPRQHTTHIPKDKDFHCASIVRIEEEPRSPTIAIYTADLHHS